MDTPQVYAVVPSSLVNALGYFSVACFFFLSGYGLTAQYRTNGEQYLQGFLRNRVLPFYLLICGLTLLYTVLTVITGNETITFKLILQSLSFGPDTIISKGWYLQVALLCYLTFYLVFRLCSHAWWRICCGIVLLSIYIAFCIIADFSVSYYQTIPNFLLGCIWHKEMDANNSRCKPSMIAVAGGAFVVVWAESVYSPVCSILFRTLATILFVVLMVSVMEKVSLESVPFLGGLGKISYEIYVTHGFFIILFRKGIVIENRVLNTLAVILCCLVFARLLHPAVKKVYLLCRK